MFNNIFVISDTHFQHDKDFIYLPRGFPSVQEMNENIIENWNNIIKPDDIVYHLGDIFLGELNNGINIISQLNGQIYLAIGNHDTDERLKYLSQLPNIKDIQFGYRKKISKSTTFFFSHYQMLTGNAGFSRTYSIHGHTHNLNRKDEGYDMMYNVSCEAINCKPIFLDEIISDIHKWSK